VVVCYVTSARRAPLARYPTTLARFPDESANVAEVKLAEQTLDTIRVARPRGRPKCRPKKLVADRGYDSSAFRAAIPWYPHVHPAQATASELESQAGTPGGGAQRGVSSPLYSGAELRRAFAISAGSSSAGNATSLSIRAGLPSP